MEPKKNENNSTRQGDTKAREAEENVRRSRGEDASGEPVDPKKTGNKPRFDRDR